MKIYTTTGKAPLNEPPVEPFTVINEWFDICDLGAKDASIEFMVGADRYVISADEWRHLIRCAHIGLAAITDSGRAVAHAHRGRARRMTRDEIALEILKALIQSGMIDPYIVTTAVRLADIFIEKSTAPT